MEKDEIDRSHIQLQKGIKQPSERLEEIEEETITKFLNHLKDLEQQGTKGKLEGETMLAENIVKDH